MGCGSFTIKYMLFIFNFFFALTGAALVVLGLYTNSYDDRLNKLLAGELRTPTIIIIAVGATVFVVAFFGCCGAIRESHCMVVTYACLLLTIFFLEIAVGVVAFVYKSRVDDGFKATMEKSFDHYYDPNYNETRLLVDSVQHGFKCCGVDNPGYWAGRLPPSCCKINQGKHNTACTGEHWENGCLGTVSDYIKSSLKSIGIVAIAIAFVEVVGIVFSLCLASSIKRAELRGYA